VLALRRVDGRHGTWQCARCRFKLRLLRGRPADVRGRAAGARARRADALVARSSSCARRPAVWFCVFAALPDGMADGGGRG